MLWQRTRGTPVDGVLAIDPPALAQILTATGPAQLPSGEQLTGDNIVALTESEAYARYPDGAVRDEYLQDVVRAVYAKLVSGAGDQQAVLEALGNAASRRRVNVWSADAGEQALLEGYSVANALPMADDGAFLLVTSQAAGENKLDYWIRREIIWTQSSSDEAVLTIKLRNTAPLSGLPTYVTGTPPLKPGEKRAPVGRQLLYVSVFLSAQAAVEEATLGGTRIGMESEVERRHPVYSQHVHIDPGQTVELRLSISEPGQGPLTLIAPHSSSRTWCESTLTATSPAWRRRAPRPPGPSSSPGR